MFNHPAGRYYRSQRRRSWGGWLILVVIAAVLAGGTFLYLNRNAEEPALSDEAAAMATLASFSDAPASSSSLSVTPISEETSVAQLALQPPSDATTRRIYFPGVESYGQIVTVAKVPGGWDVSNLQQLVGHLEGTAWFDRPGNIVLAGHFEDELGNPGPFRYLYYAKVGDRILVQNGADAPLTVFEVREVFSTDPSNLEILRNTPETRLTLITCDDWNPNREVYDKRLIVVAEPIGTMDNSS